MECPFCVQLGISTSGLPSNEVAAALTDAFPANPGHMLIVPRRHAEDLFTLTKDEHRALWDLVPAVKASIEERHQPDGYTIGLNAGVAAGQTVAHVHLHVIPRYKGDVADPRGGVRLVIPDRAKYWEGRA
jgi:diadenosine tetraphosphate (Ap4A) HIT family hydrolase